MLWAFSVPLLSLVLVFLFLTYICHHFKSFLMNRNLKKTSKKRKQTPLIQFLMPSSHSTPPNNIFVFFSFKFNLNLIFHSIFKILLFLFPIWHIFHQLKKKNVKQPPPYNFNIFQDPKILGCTCYARKGTTKFTSRIASRKQSQIESQLDLQSCTHIHAFSPIG